jgi:tetratricopeptide (TPR) repeat protein
MNVNNTLELKKALLQEKEETEPLTYDEYMLLGDIQYLTYEIYAARVSYIKALELNKTSEVYYALGIINQEINEPAVAEGFYLAAIKENPNYGEAYRNLAMLYIEMNRAQEAEKLLDDAFVLNPDNLLPFIEKVNEELKKYKI